MAVSPDALTRATRALAQEPVTGWTELSAAIMSRVRATARPGETITVYASDGSPAHDEQCSYIYVAERVLVAALRRATTMPAAAPEDIDILMDGRRCAEIHVHLVGTWGADLQRVGTEAHHRAVTVIRELLGPDPGFDPDRDLHVTVTDIDAPVEGEDPR